MKGCVKQEMVDHWSAAERGSKNDDVVRKPTPVIELSDSQSGDNNDAISRE
jgi:hypothetical protein